MIAVGTGSPVELDDGVSGCSVDTGGSEVEEGSASSDVGSGVAGAATQQKGECVGTGLAEGENKSTHCCSQRLSRLRHQQFGSGSADLR